MNLVSRSGPSLLLRAGIALPQIPPNFPDRLLKFQSYPSSMLNNFRVPEPSTPPSLEHGSVLSAQPSPSSSPHWGHSSSPGCTGRPGSASQLADGIPWSRLSGSRGLSVPCPIFSIYSPDAALHQPGLCCSRSLRAVGGSRHCKGCQHCNQFQ